MPRRYVKRKTYKKRRVYKRRIPRNPGSANAVRYFKLKSLQINLTSDAIGRINPVIDNNILGYPEHEHIAQLFDVYRVCAMKIQFFPYMPNNVSTFTNYKPIFISYDIDTFQALVSANDALQYDRFKAKNLYRPWSFYTRVPKITNSLNNSAQIFQGGYIDIANPISVGCILTFADGLSVSTQYGKILTTIYLKAKLRH